MPASEASGDKPRLVEGIQLRCPKCSALGHPFRDFKPLELVEQYRHELNPIYKHRKDRGGCGHVFSPGDPWIIEAYLSGDLVPKSSVDQLKTEIAYLREQLEDAGQPKVEIEVNQHDSEERRVGST